MVLTARAEAGSGVGYRALFEPHIRPALIVAVGLFFLQQLSGINAVIYYAPEIFNQAGFSSGDTRILATIGIGTVNFATTVLAMFLIDRLGRRPLLVLGFAGTAVTMLIIALAITNPTLVPSWLVIVLLLLYIASFAISIGPLPHVMMSEVFPLRVRGPGMSMASISNWGFNFVVVFAFPADVGRTRACLRFLGVCRDLSGRHRVHPAAGAGDHGAIPRGDRETP